ncbi:MAG: pyridoxamine 5'-phosphate oxidase family protein [Pseudomonadota bacterium]|nr:pyridoxamine 5'-phosphate oxidase family protein [Pseudomonadota bacterium]
MDAIKDYETSSGMATASILAARDALLAQKSLTVAVLDESSVPDMGVAPFIRRDDGLYIYTSHLASHVQALLAQKRASFTITLDEADTVNIWARHRLKFAGKVVEVARDDPDFSGLCDDFTGAHGNTMPLIKNFTDFHMLRITPENGVLVLGFARAFRVKGASFDIVAHLSRG